MMSRILAKAARFAGRRLCRYRGRSFADTIERSVGILHRRLNNVHFNITLNGELRVLKATSEIAPKCIFDIGANQGGWTRLAAALYPSCKIHSFEIVPSTFEELIKNTPDLPNVTLNSFGLSNEEGTITISIGDDTAICTGHPIEGYRHHEEYYTRQIQCVTRTASEYLREKDLQCVDFVKIDVEGMELKVIRGFGDQLKNVRAVQFEYGIFNIASHDLLCDICKYFRERGFVVGKIFPRYVDFFEYHFDMENFYGSNFLAVKDGEKKLIDKLSRYGMKH